MYLNISIWVLFTCTLSALVVAFEQISDETGRALGRYSFITYWNIPTFQCARHNITFTELAAKYNISQNHQDKFRGDKVALLYDPGAFPAILKSSKTHKITLRNNGVPQEGNLTLHLEIFKEAVTEQIPNAEFSGLAIIDFESWRPVFRQNFGTLTPYKELSKDIVKQKHPFWPKQFIEKEAQRQFERSAKLFMQETIRFAKNLRSKATWGYYAYPYCFNMSPNNMNTDCPTIVRKENEMIEWLFLETDNFHPSLYLRQNNLTPKQRLQLIIGRINESHRLIGYIRKRVDPLIIPYFWYKYQDTTEFLSKDDVYNSLTTLKNLNIDGLLLWGSSNDVNTKEKCQELYDYINTVLGPGLANL